MGQYRQRQSGSIFYGTSPVSPPFSPILSCDALDETQLDQMLASLLADQNLRSEQGALEQPESQKISSLLSPALSPICDTLPSPSHHHHHHDNDDDTSLLNPLASDQCVEYFEPMEESLEIDNLTPAASPHFIQSCPMPHVDLPITLYENPVIEPHTFDDSTQHDMSLVVDEGYCDNEYWDSLLASSLSLRGIRGGGVQKRRYGLSYRTSADTGGDKANFVFQAPRMRRRDKKRRKGTKSRDDASDHKLGSTVTAASGVSSGSPSPRTNLGVHDA